MLRLVLHGGAGTIDGERRGAYRSGLRAALAAGWGVLAAGGDAVAAVVRAVETMERDEHAFNAGVGGSPTRDGRVECDACIVRGRDGAVGAVASLTRSRTPVRVAERVLRESPHVFIAGVGADALVDDPVDNETLLTPYTRGALEAWRARQGAPAGTATVGAIALDAGGDLAAATSTGGVLGKWPGRIGDCPIAGAGTWADHDVAVSCTGGGEAFIRSVTARTLALRLEAGRSAADALAQALADVGAMGGRGGLIALRRDGTIAFAFDTPQMAAAWRAGDRHGFEERVDVWEGAGVRVPVRGATAEPAEPAEP